MAFESKLEPGFRCVPISPSEASASIRLCVVTRETADPASGHFILLRQTQDARVLLGAISDASGRIHEWVELWYQDVSGETVNAVRDQQWDKLGAILEEAEPDSHYGLPKSPKEPVFLETKTWQPMVAASAEGSLLSLCTDDRALANAGLPVYSGSAARFGRAAEKFYPLNQQATESGGTEPFSSNGAADLNGGAGGLIVRRFAPLSIEEFADVLGGRAWNGLTNGKKVFRLQGIYREFADEAAIRTKGRHFLGTRRDAAGRLAETLYLKMTLIRQCLRKVQDETKRTGLPMLNIDASTFRVSLGAIDTELPYCWSAQVSVARVGESMVLDVPGGRAKYFAARGASSVSIFRPEELGLARNGRGSVRIKRILAEAQGGIVAEGTLVAPDRLPVGTNELLRLTLPMEGNKSFALIGTLNPSAALAPGETGFRTIPMDLDPHLEQVLRSYEGTPFSQVPYEVIPPLSTPCDLYSLGVLALRILFAGGNVTLPIALDAMLSLGRAVTARGIETSFEESVREILEMDPRWMPVLGPQQVMKDAPEELIPMEAWVPVLALIVRFFPGLGTYSICADLAAAPTEAPHTIFTEPLNQLDLLLARLRALCFSSWRENNEVAALLARYVGDAA